MALPPLVEPAAPLTEAEFARYSRHVLLPQLGEPGQRRLKAARVLVLGAGGLGAPALQYLAAAGVGTLGIIDDDVVEESNLQRQVIHATADIGRAKVDSAAAAVTALNPHVRVRTHGLRLTAENAPGILADYDLVLDGADNFPTRYLVSDAAAELGLPVLWASVLGFDAQVSLFWSRPPAGDGVTLRDLFPHPPAPGAVPSCSQAGVVGAMVGQVGSLLATEAVKLIAGIGHPLLGRVLVFDALAAAWRELPLRRRTGLRTTSLTPAPTAPAAGPGPSTPTAVPTLPTLPAGPTGPTGQAGPPEPTGVPVVAEVPAGVTLLDVREPDEVAGGAIPGSVHIPLARVLTTVGRAELSRREPVVVYCRTGPRAERAAAELAADGYDVSVLAGGWSAWSSAHPGEPARAGAR
ncbi:molybdopterin-synthase adenylyltransferase MoeB [Pseudactinotalea sp. HY160]|nr:molybdopterin-synthase adenylyltransferase MoeB [Pseudactinotalea sp. HY160]